MGITKATIVRTAVLFFALLNQGLMLAGFAPLPFEDEAVGEAVTTALTAAAALVCWWKNNSFTKAAQLGDERMREARAAAKGE